MKYARIDNNVIVEFFETDGDITTMFPPVLIWVDITDMDPVPGYGWVYNGSTFSEPVVVGPSAEELAILARIERDRLLRTIYDAGIMMAFRAKRMASTPEETAYSEGKIVELDEYAELLIAIPDQPGFPQTIIWPTAPTK